MMIRRLHAYGTRPWAGPVGIGSRGRVLSAIQLSQAERAAAVGHDCLSGDPSGLVRGEDEDASGDIVGLGHAMNHLAAEAVIDDRFWQPF